ncbi:MAG: hypothetical protein GY729_02230 [Desulfobacteraceae bacterium]|nr:hypothetical protein [Desulfobacteraceae bacterium]
MSRKKLNFTDLQLLETIQSEYADAYLERIQNKSNNPNNSMVYLPIDLDKIAKKLGLPNGEPIFQRLYRHLEKKYGYKNSDGTQCAFFTPVAGEDKNCVSFAHLCAIVASLKDEQKDLKITRWIAIAGLCTAIVIPILIELLKVYFLGGKP